ncbi:hypothetical protein NQ318_014822 [Aromia moschata]|uniref:Mos1 transposase HTH domain-containing protein n=1 Tax=Aromia moschata TaxID=1265417 RepID=A0AAV8ZBU7_9CUCU|nr:hypothetical protein NQ318_014822 [Aromia moschata]
MDLMVTLLHRLTYSGRKKENVIDRNANLNSTRNTKRKGNETLISKFVLRCIRVMVAEKDGANGDPDIGRMSVMLGFLKALSSQKVNFCLQKAYTMLNEVYGNECLFRTQVFEWFKQFKEGRETTEDDPRPGRPSTSKTGETIEKPGKLIHEDRRLSIQELAEITGIDKECVRQILHELFNMRKVPPEQKGIKNEHLR